VRLRGGRRGETLSNLRNGALSTAFRKYNDTQLPPLPRRGEGIKVMRLENMSPEFGNGALTPIRNYQPPRTPSADAGYPERQDQKALLGKTNGTSEGLKNRFSCSGLEGSEHAIHGGLGVMAVQGFSRIRAKRTLARFLIVRCQFRIAARSDGDGCADPGGG